MKLDIAIKVLEYYEGKRGELIAHPIRDAIKLGIEALKQIQWLHESHVLHDDELLPGETKD